MKITALRLQGLAQIIYTIFVLLLFASMLFFATAFYETFLYGNLELTEFYDNELQIYNRFLLAASVVDIILFVLVVICSPKKYYPSYVTYPIIIISMIITVVTAILCITKMMPILDFYRSYDYSSIEKLKDFSYNSFYTGFTMFSSIGLIVSSILLGAVSTVGLTKYIKLKGRDIDA